MSEVSGSVLKAIENSPSGICTLDLLESLKLCDSFTLKTTLSRLNKSGKITRLKRGVYSTNPIRDSFACAQSIFNGYLGFSSALYLHNIITEMPFTVTVVTINTSKVKEFGSFEFRAVALHEKAVGTENKNCYFISSRAKTLFDCIYLPKYGVETEKLIAAFREAKLSKSEWKEFDNYVSKFAGKRTVQMKEVKKATLGAK